MSTQLPLPIPARYRNSDPVTSRLAAESFTEKKLSELQAIVLTWFRSVGEATDSELEDAFKTQNFGFSTLRKRRCDLVELGRLADSGKKRMNSRNRQMVVWRTV